MGGFLAGLQSALASDAQLTWADEAFVLGHGVRPWSDLPVWLPREDAAMHEVDCARARASGLVCRPLVQTAQDTAAWLSEQTKQTAPGGLSLPAVGLTPKREAELLRAWHRVRR